MTPTTNHKRLDTAGQATIQEALQEQMRLAIKCTREDEKAIILHERNRGACVLTRAERSRQAMKVYSEVASTQAVQSNGERAFERSPVVHHGFRPS